MRVSFARRKSDRGQQQLACISTKQMFESSCVTDLRLIVTAPVQISNHSFSFHQITQDGLQPRSFCCRQGRVGPDLRDRCRSSQGEPETSCRSLMERLEGSSKDYRYYRLDGMASLARPCCRRTLRPNRESLLTLSLVFAAPGSAHLALGYLRDLDLPRRIEKIGAGIAGCRQGCSGP